ncbi:MAG: MBL fold metallo-hydrolase [Candidatus Hodarchaeota archaeon]
MNLEIKKEILKNKPKLNDSLTVLGSSGGRFGIIHNGGIGFRLFLSGVDLQIDTGVGTFLRTIKLGKINPIYSPIFLDAILCSHAHIDHFADLIPFIEGMTLGTKINKGHLITNETILSIYSKLFDYHLNLLEKTILNRNEKNTLEINGINGELTISATPTRHLEIQKEDTGIGFLFRSRNKCIWYTSDTLLTPEIMEYIEKFSIDIIIANGADYKRSIRTDMFLDLKDLMKLVHTFSPKFILIAHYDEYQTSVMYKIAHAMYLQKKLYQKGEPTRVFPAVEGMEIQLNGDNKIRFNFNNEESKTVNRFLELNQTI